MRHNIYISIFILMILSVLYSCTQSKRHKSEIYLVDSSMVSEIKRKIEPFKGKYNANISFAVFENEKEVTGKNDLPALSFTSFANNILAVDCLNGTDNGFGFFLMIGKDTSFLNLKVLSKGDSILFRKVGESTLQPELLVNSRSRKVSLANKPAFTHGEVIQGLVEMESDYFYEVRNNKERKIKFRIKAFFKSEPIPVNKNQYKTLVK